MVYKDEHPDVVLIGNGSEVSTLVSASDILKAGGLKVQIVSVPSVGLFKNQPKEYRECVIPAGIPVFGLTAGLPSTLMSLVGDKGYVFGLDHFGESAPYKVLDEKFGFTPVNIADKISTFMGK